MSRVDTCTSPLPGEWMKGKMIGCGSFGSVHLAMSKSTGGLFVVKSSQSREGALALENEARILESLNSPYVVRCMGIENGKQKLCSVFMEYMAGGSLADVAQIFGGAFDEAVVRLYSREILHGLKYLHENGIVHCDLKCKNVLLSSSGNVKLADFGCAKRINDSTTKNGDSSMPSTTIGGTPLWMAPEVLRNEGLDFGSDIWSLGCTVIEMATGRPPWAAEISDPIAAVFKIASSNKRPQFPRHFSSEGLDFLAKCLERDPKGRWSAEQLLNHPFVSGNPTRVSRKGEACSPTSTLDDIGTYDHGTESYEGNQLSRRNPFTMCCDERNVTTVWPPECRFESSDNWITVR